MNNRTNPPVLEGVPIRYMVTRGSDEMMCCACGLGADGMGDTTLMPARRVSKRDNFWYITDWSEHGIEQQELNASHLICNVCGLVVPLSGNFQFHHEPYDAQRDLTELVTRPQYAWLKYQFDTAHDDFALEEAYLIPCYEYATQWVIPVGLDPDFEPRYFVNDLYWPSKNINPLLHGEHQTRPYIPRSVKMEA